MKDPCRNCELHRCDYESKEISCPSYQAQKLLDDIKAETQHEKDMVGDTSGHILPGRWKL